MLARIKAFLNGVDGRAARAAGDDGLTEAAVAVFVESALMDGVFHDAERRTIIAILVERFELSADDANALVDAALAETDGANRMFKATQIIRDGFSEEQRIDMMEMLWQVAYADGVLDDYEANLVRRVAGLLYVKDQDSGGARKRALKRLGLEDTNEDRK